MKCDFNVIANCVLRNVHNCKMCQEDVAFRAQVIQFHDDYIKLAEDIKKECPDLGKKKSFVGKLLDSVKKTKKNTNK